jgi:hypothetical protein
MIARDEALGAPVDAAIVERLPEAALDAEMDAEFQVPRAQRWRMLR